MTLVATSTKKRLAAIAIAAIMGCMVFANQAYANTADYPLVEAGEQPAVAYVDGGTAVAGPSNSSRNATNIADDQANINSNANRKLVAEETEGQSLEGASAAEQGDVSAAATPQENGPTVEHEDALPVCASEDESAPSSAKDGEATSIGDAPATHEREAANEPESDAIGSGDVQIIDPQTQAELKKRGFTYLQDQKIWVYYDNNGNMLKGEHRLFDGMYFFDPETGAMSFGWKNIDSNTKVYHNEISGRAYHGVRQVDNNMYLFSQSQGAVSYGWADYKGNRTYADPYTGVINTGGQTIDGAHYYIDPSTFFVSRWAGISKLLATAHSLLGVPYVWLGVYPDDGGMDCASFTWYLYKQLGITIGFETYDSVKDGFAVSMDNLEPGDLVFMYYSYRGPEHVVMYAGNGMIYEEPDFGGHCQYVPLASKNAWDATARRILSD